MGACDFVVVQKGTTAKAAFSEAVEEARHWSGHGGYTGTIAEKHKFTIITEAKCSTVKEAEMLADSLMRKCDKRIDDKWGPAGCIVVENEGAYVFFGYASS